MYILTEDLRFSSSVGACGSMCSIGSPTIDVNELAGRSSLLQFRGQRIIGCSRCDDMTGSDIHQQPPWLHHEQPAASGWPDVGVSKQLPHLLLIEVPLLLHSLMLELGEPLGKAINLLCAATNLSLGSSTSGNAGPASTFSQAKDITSTEAH